MSQLGNTAAPIVKWAGGKARLLDEIRARVPASYGRYHEPFLGGGAVFFGLAPQGGAALSDANADLIAMYIAVRDDVEGVIRLLEQYARGHSNSQYYGTRTLWNGAALTPLQRAAAFIYLNKTCFNGLWRVNKSGEFNVPWGKHETMTPDVSGLRAASRALAGVELRCCGWEATLAVVESGDFVYLDPPYVPNAGKANFTAYTAGGFGEDEQRALARGVRWLADHGVHVLLSNSDTPLVRELYAGLQIDAVQCGRAIGGKGASRKAVGEVLVRP